MQEKDFGAVENGCKWIIALMSLFPEMHKYEDFLVSLRKVNEQGPSREITAFIFRTIKRFF